MFEDGCFRMGSRILVVDDSPTIRKVVAAILARHDFDPVVAEDGIDALGKLGEAPADLVLVDFVMPRMNGYQFCMSLRQRPELADMPVVLMSAKGDKIRGKFVEQTGALDAITKPFDARALVAVVQGALDKKAAGAEARPPRAELGSGPDPSDVDPARLEHSRARVAEHLTKLLLPELRRAVPNLEHATLVQSFARALTPVAGAELTALLMDTDFAGERADVLAGDLESVSIAEILQLLDVQRKTGALTVSHKSSRVTLFMRNGALDFATYAGLPEEFLLGRYLVQTGALTRRQLEECIETTRVTGALLGDHVVSARMMTEEQLRLALVQQTSELVYEIVRWRSGRFRFVSQAESQLAERAELGLPTAGLVMEGFRRVDEWRLIEGSFDFDDVLYRDEPALNKLGSSELTLVERKVLAAIDGEKTIAELIDELDQSSFETCKVLYRFLNSRLVKTQ